MYVVSPVSKTVETGINKVGTCVQRNATRHIGVLKMGEGRDSKGTDAVADSILKKKHVPDFDRLTGPTVVTTDGKTPAVASKTGDSTGTAKAPPTEETKTTETKTAETKAAETKAAETKAAETKAAETKVETAKTPEVAKETGTATTTDKTAVDDKTKAPSPELIKGLAAAKEVARILDNDVPTANGAKDLKSAEAAYNKAIEIAKSVPKETIEQAKVEYDAVLKAKLAETDPEKKRALADRQAELYTLTRVKDCALGNMALWYYRQGRTEEGTTKFLEAAGLTPEDAKSMKGLPKDQFDALANKLDPNAPILTDVNFMAQYTRIKESGQPMPDEFVAIHKHLREQKEKAAAQATPEVALQNNAAGADSPATKHLESLVATYDGAANTKALKDFQELDAKLTAGTETKLSEADRKTLDAGVKAADTNFEVATAVYAVAREQLDKTVTPAKQEEFRVSSEKVAAELEKIRLAGPKDKDGNPQISETDKGLLMTINNQTISQADRDAAKAKLNATYPEFGKAMDAALKVIDGDPRANELISKTNEVAAQLQQAGIDKAKAHYMQAAHVARSGDNAGAKVILESGFVGLPENLAAEMKTIKPIVDLATAVGADLNKVTAPPVENTTTTGAGAEQTSTVNPELSPEAQARVKAANDALAKLPVADQQRIVAMEPSDLLASVEKMKTQGLEKLPEARATYEVLLAKIEDPERINGLKQEMTVRIDAMEKNQKVDGTPLDAATRLQYHKDNTQLLSNIAVVAQVRQDYAAYLGGKNSGAIDTKRPDQLQPMMGRGDDQMDLNKSMDEQLQLMYKAADGLPIDLIKREQALLTKSLADSAVGGIDKEGTIARSLDYIQGNKENPGVIDLAVTSRTRAAMMYVSQGAVYDPATGGFTIRDKTKVDELYQPTKALALVTEADAKYKEIHGANATDPELEKVKAIGAQLSPENFKALTAEAKRQTWSSISDVAGGVLAFSAEIGVAALTRNSKLGMASRHALGTGAAFGVATTGRALIMRGATGEWENPGETAVHGAAVTALVSGMKYAHMGGTKLFNTKPAQALEDMSVAARRFGNEYGGTFGQYGEQLAAKGFTKEAQAIANSGMAGKTFAQLTDDELRAILPKSLSTNGMSAIGKVEAGVSNEFKAIAGLEKAGVVTVGDLQKVVAADLNKAQEFIAAAKAAGVPAKATYREAMEQMGKSGNPLYNSPSKIAAEVEALESGMKRSIMPGGMERVTVVPKVWKYDGASITLPTGKVKTVGQLDEFVSKATPQSELERMFPALKGKPEAAVLRDLERTTPKMFGNLESWKPLVGSNRSVGWNKVGELTPGTEGFRAGLNPAQWMNKNLVQERFYAGFRVPKGEAAFVDAQKVAGAVARREDALMFGSYVVGATGYRSINGLYDKLYKGVDENGNKKQYTFGEALSEANLGTTNPTMKDFVLNRTVMEGLFAGYAFKGLIKAGQAEASALGIRKALGQGIKNPIGTAIMMPGLEPAVTGVMKQNQLAPLAEGGDKPLTDYDYSADLGMTMQTTPAEVPTTTRDSTVVVPPKQEPAVDSSKVQVEKVPDPKKTPTTPVDGGESGNVTNPNQDP